MAPRRSVRRLAAAAGLALGLTGMVTGNAVAAGHSQTGSAPLIVRTDKGAVRGFFAADAREFLGIPYAAPPVGALRWRPARLAAPWTGIRDATAFGNVCAQAGNVGTGVTSTSTAEDCLVVNVYTPRTLPRRPLPVMVWIHGGGFSGGTANIYDSAVLAAKGNVIVVNINYRVNAFGFLALPSLDRESRDNSSGDYGLQDQQAALRWVKRNSFAFGGNPFNVTIFGESAGGASVCDNMSSPTASGLFNRAIAESGCVSPGVTKQAAEQLGATLAKNLGCTDARTAAGCLRGKPAADILQAEGTMRFSPVAGGRTLPRSSLDAFRSGQFIHVPLLQGSNHDEGRFFVAVGFDLPGHPITAQQYPSLVQGMFGASATPAILARYPLSSFASPDLAFAQIFTDSRFSCPALLADNLAAGSGAYGYEFSDPSPPDIFAVLGIHFTFPVAAGHSTELQYVFQRFPILDRLPPFTPAQLRLSDQIIQYWSRFAATGTPNARPFTAPAPHWPRFTAGHQEIQELVPDATAPEPAAAFSAAHQCAFWQTIEG
jgi:para-nitrobenzyl esterase